MNKKILQLTFLLYLLPQQLFAAGAYLVDDGGVAEAKKLQAENWLSSSKSGENILVTNPAYQILPNLEFAVQESYSNKAQNINTLWPQLKYMWYRSDKIMSATTIGNNYSSTDQKSYGAYAYSSTTAILNDWLDLNIYLGWQNWRHATRNNKSVDFLNYGLGAQIHLHKNLLLIPEYFQTNGTQKNGASTRPATQFGLRYIASNRLNFDLIYGYNINGNLSDWLTFGLTFAF